MGGNKKVSLFDIVRGCVLSRRRRRRRRFSTFVFEGREREREKGYSVCAFNLVAIVSCDAVGRAMFFKCFVLF